MIPKKDRGQNPDNPENPENPDIIVPSVTEDGCESCLEVEEDSCPGASACKDDKNSMS